LVVPLLRDSSVRVRESAMLAVGAQPNVVSTDDLLGWLHDGDAGVRALCEKALRSRGLQERHIRLGRLITDPSARVRLKLIDMLKRTTDLEPGVWLRRLSHDPVAAVRAAAVRAIQEQELATLADRIEQMAQNDPCPTVRQLAQYYLVSQRSGQ
jgi:HEAT repeat protein